MDHSLDCMQAHTQVEEFVQNNTMHFQEKKHKDLELAKYGEGNVNMGAGYGETCSAEGGRGHIGQIATCNLNLKATRFSEKKGDRGEERRWGRCSDRSSGGEGCLSGPRG